MKKKVLKQARDSQELVRVVRLQDLPAFEGYVAAVGDQWCVLVSMMSSVYQGHLLLRNADIRKLREPFAKPKRTKKALKDADRWPPSSPELLDLDSTRSLLWTAGSLCPLLSVAKEPHADLACTIVSLTERQAKATQHDGKALTLRLEDITKVVLWDPTVERLRA